MHLETSPERMFEILRTSFRQGKLTTQDAIELINLMGTFPAIGWDCLETLQAAISSGVIELESPQF